MWLIAINPWTFFLPDFVHEHLQLLVYGDGASTFQALLREGKFGAHIHVDDFFGVQLIFVLYSESKKYINFHTSTKIILDFSFNQYCGSASFIMRILDPKNVYEDLEW